MAEKHKRWSDEEVEKLKEEVRAATSDLEWLDSEHLHGKKNIVTWKKITSRAFPARDWQEVWRKYMFVNCIPKGGNQWSHEEIQKLREEVRNSEWLDSEHVMWQKITSRSFPARNWKEVRRKYKTLDPQFFIKHGNNDFGVAVQMPLSSESPLLTNVSEKKSKRTTKWQTGEYLHKMKEGGVFASCFCSCGSALCNIFDKFLK